MTGEPLPHNYDYLGFERCKGYVRGVNHVRCQRCNATGIDPEFDDPTNNCGNIWIHDRDTGDPVCRECGAYGDVPAQNGASVRADVERAPKEDNIAQEIFWVALGLDNL